MVGFDVVALHHRLGDPARLPTYRLYRLDGAGKIMSADWIEAGGDEDALREARERDGSARLELWERNRLVGNLGPDGGHEPAA